MATIETAMEMNSSTPSKRDQDLSTIECLILAQAVYEHGTNAWQSVSKVLSKHPALARPKNFFSPQSCQQIYARLMTEASLEISEASNVPHAPSNLTLAHRHYSARLVQLRDLIASEELKFKRIVAEIDEIRNGAWDDRIKTKLGGKDNGSLIDVLNAQPTAHPVELRQDTEEHVTSANDIDIDILVQHPDSGDTDARGIGDAAEGPVDTSLTEPSGDTKAIGTTPPAGDITQEEPTLVDDEPLEDSTNDARSTESGPLHETAEIDIDESISLPESEEKVGEKLQQREGKRKVTDIDNLDENLREKKRLRDTSMDVDEQASTSRQRTTTNNELLSHQQTPPSIPNKRFQTVIGMLHSQISQHRNGNIFHNPIKNSEAPDYHDIIKRPMDLKTIKGKVKDGLISNSLEFQRDVYLMFANAMMYNRPGSDIYHMAEEMMAESEVHINTFRQTEGFVRSTRS